MEIKDHQYLLIENEDPSQEAICTLEFKLNGYQIAEEHPEEEHKTMQTEMVV